MAFYTDRWLPFIYDCRQYLTAPRPIRILNPYSSDEVRYVCQLFYEKYYGDDEERTVILGINPGRLGAGITGVNFTDPDKLERLCGIPNEFEKKAELSSRFIYDWIERAGSIEAFYARNVILAVCPLGFVKEGKNINYYDDKNLLERSEKLIIKHQNLLQEEANIADNAFMLGKGKNFQYFKKLNAKHGWYKEIVALPHPRWVMQYRYHERYDWMDRMHAALAGVAM